VGGVAHTPKAGAQLSGDEYEAADHHVITLSASDVGAAADDHDHDSTYATVGHSHASYAADDHTHDAAYAAIDHSHGASGLTHPQVLARGLGA